MRSRTVRAAALAATSALIGLVGVAANAAAAPVEPVVPADPAPVVAEVVAVPASTTLPLFGTPLTIDITTGPGGALSSVMINPADGFTATTVKPNKVAFVNEEGTAKVLVKARDGGQRVEARAGSLDALLGDGGWVGEIFPGASTNVAFTIADRGDGSPDITGITVSDTAGVTAEIGAVEYSDHDGELRASVKIRFTSGDQTRWLSIKAEVETDEHDGETGHARAKVQVTLSKIRNAPLVGEAAVGPQHWDGVLCSGDAASIDYVVAADGTISDVVISPEPDSQHVEGNGLEVRFSGGERVRIRVSDHDGELVVRVQDKIRCRDAADPTVNVPVVTNPDETHDGDHQGRGDGDKGDKGGRHGGEGDHHDGGDDTSTTTTLETAPVDAGATANG